MNPASRSPSEVSVAASLTLTLPCAGAMRAVSPVAGFGQAVWAECGELLRCQQFVQGAGGLNMVQVVDQLAPFVPEPPELLEPNGPGHGR